MIVTLAVDVFHCLPDELSARLDKLGPGRARRAIVELLAYYQLQTEDRAKREWQQAIDRAHDAKRKTRTKR